MRIVVIKAKGLGYGQLQEPTIFNHIERVYSSGLSYLHFVLWLFVFEMQYEFDLSSADEVLFGFTAQFIEVGGLKKELQGFKPFFEFLILALLEKLTHSLIILSLCLCFHAGVQFRLKFNMESLILCHPYDSIIHLGFRVIRRDGVWPFSQHHKKDCPART